MKGYIHSVESAGTLDGPGLRYVLFLHGCVFRCAFCHNPDTWAANAKSVRYTSEILSDILRYADFFKLSGGGVTLSGGEPLMQKEFVLDLVKKLKEKGLHTAIDTCGGVDVEDETIKKIIEIADMFLLDVKNVDEQLHIKITGFPQKQPLKFLKTLVELKKRVWIRVVVLRGYSCGREYAEKLAKYLSPYKSGIEFVELLPYHDMAKYKWKNLGLAYQLEDTLPTTKEEVEETAIPLREQGFKVRS